MKTIPQVIKEAANKWPDKLAIKFKGQPITYSDQYHKICSLAKGLQNLGIKKGDHVATLLGGCIEWFYISYAITMVGAVIVPINVTFRNEELHYVLRRSDAKALIMTDKFRNFNYIELMKKIIPEVDDSTPGFLESKNLPNLKTVISLSEDRKEYTGFFDFNDVINSGMNYSHAEINKLIEYVKPEDPSYILFTSGSTAFPKPVLRSHGSNIGIAYYMNSDTHFDDVLLGYQPFYHVGGCIYATLGSALFGASIILMEYFEPEKALRFIESEKVTKIGGFETHFKTLSEHPNFKPSVFKSVRRVQLACGPEWYDRLKELGLSHCTLVHHYGFTEGTGVIMPPEEKDETIRKNSNGKPFPGVEIKIINPETGMKQPANSPGEICLKGWTLFQGYYKMPKETAESFDEEGYFRTGDYGWLDEDGYVYYRGRYKQMIKTGGENVSEREVEMFLEGHPHIKTVQVVGVPDSKWGEAVTAIIEPKSGRDLTIHDIKGFSEGKISGYKIPKQIVKFSSSEWPVTPTGKYDKQMIREMAIGRLGIDKVKG